MTETRIEIGTGDMVIIDKLYGPAVFATLRITPDVPRGVWVIERQRLDTDEWHEVVTIEAQLDEEF